MLRVSDPEAIRNPEAYLFTVAGNLLRENAVADRRHAHEVAVEAAEPTPALTSVPGFESAIDATRRVRGSARRAGAAAAMFHRRDPAISGWAQSPGHRCTTGGFPTHGQEVSGPRLESLPSPHGAPEVSP